jgi:hypothetical protein
MMPYLDRDGFPIYYEVTAGQNQGLPVLLSHCDERIRAAR